MLSVACLHDPEEIAELPMEFRPRRTVFAVAREFEVDGWCQCSRIDRHMPDEMGRLRSPASAQGEKVIGASADAGGVGGPPIDRESLVDVVAAFSCLDIREVDALARQFGPGDVSLVMRNIDALRRKSPLRRMPSPRRVRGSCGVRNEDHCQEDKREPLAANGSHGAEANGRP